MKRALACHAQDKNDYGLRVNRIIWKMAVKTVGALLFL